MEEEQFIEFFDGPAWSQTPAAATGHRALSLPFAGGVKAGADDPVVHTKTFGEPAAREVELRGHGARFVARRPGGT